MSGPSELQAFIEKYLSSPLLTDLSLRVLTMFARLAELAKVAPEPAEELGASLLVQLGAFQELIAKAEREVLEKTIERTLADAQRPPS